MPDRTVIVNSTPIIALASINSLFILKDLYGEVFIPAAVYDEISAKKDSKSFIELKKAAAEWIHIRKIDNVHLKKFFRIQLHDGEVEVMILGKELNAALLIIDDKIAKKYANYLDFKVTGTLGVLLKAKEVGLVKKVKPYVDALIENGIYIGKQVYSDILKLSDEDF